MVSTLNSLERAEGNVSPSAFKLLFFLCQKAKDDPGKYIELALSDIETGVKLSRPTISKAIALLEEKGYIKVDRQLHINAYMPT